MVTATRLLLAFALLLLLLSFFNMPCEAAQKNIQKAQKTIKTDSRRTLQKYIQLEMRGKA